MTPIFFDSSSQNYSPYPSDLHHEHHLSNHQFLSPNSQASSSSNSLTTHLFFNSSVHDQNAIFDRELRYPQNQLEGDNFGSQPYTNPNMNNDQRIGNNDEKGVEISTWNKSGINNMANDQIPMKWMSSKMRVMLKMKKSDPVNLRFYNSKVEDQKPPTSSMEETDNSSNSTSSNNNIPIRVCSDCNTTKTPLWRSGPRGPKSLCNACGIRQRKARRALAAAAAAAENGNGNVSVPIIAPIKVAKTQYIDHKKISNGHITKYKKRQYNKQITITTPSPSPSPPLSPSPSPSPLPSPSSSSSQRKNCVEEFLVSLSKNLTYYRVFPQDEKEAAILLMALSCGYAHET